MRGMISFAAMAAMTAFMCSVAAAQGYSQTTTSTSVTTRAPYDFTSMNDRDRAIWLIRDMRAADRWEFDQMMQWAPSNIEMLIHRSLSNVQQLGLQQLMMGAESSATTTTTTTVTQPVPTPTPPSDQTSTTQTTTSSDQTQTTTTQTTTTAPAPVPQTNVAQTTTTRTTVTNPNWMSNINYSGGRMSDFQAEDTLLMGLNTQEQGVMRWWMNTLTDNQQTILLNIVKDTFDPNASMYPFYNSYFRNMTITTTTRGSF